MIIELVEVNSIVSFGGVLVKVEISVCVFISLGVSMF